MKHYCITVTVAVPPEADEHLQTPQGVEDEVRSWLTGLHADVEAVTVEGVLYIVVPLSDEEPS